ncbi:Acyl carrier protein [Mycobacterium rhizamassiliense]|uniref:Acyl carrier protein n=1 Tax=Mycobacterium rhizamassiliense TaxID=1841860 RepID=A0A2U3P008_9MYCO|nr:acyl carrier protein [Mycobacterium rhizamassiliense]SPM37076.1 Acyl carrier protein [Mycobacterium rhizamassiliense]
MVDPTKIKEVMAAVLEVDPATISDDDSMDSIESWNSLRQMSLVLALEEEFGVSFPDEDAANATSFKLLSLVLQEQVA